MCPVSEIQTVNTNCHLNGAAIVSSDGKEIAITESMMQRAFEQFESSNFYPSSLILQAKAFKKHHQNRPFHLKLV